MEEVYQQLDLTTDEKTQKALDIDQDGTVTETEVQHVLMHMENVPVCHGR